MHIQKARQRLISFEVEIRRSQKEKIFTQLRQELTMSQIELVNAHFKTFVEHKHSKIPQICLLNFQNIELSLFEQLVTAMHKKQVSYIPTTQMSWYIDCTSSINLKFMSQQIMIDCPNILNDFFKATVATNEQILKNKIQGSCTSNLQKDQRTESLQIYKSYQSRNSYQSQYLVALLNFWSIYIERSQDGIQKKDFAQIMNIFKIYTEEKDVLLKRQSSGFINTILNHIKISNFLLHYHNPNSLHHEIAKQCYSFIGFIKMHMPYLIKKAVDYRLIFYQIAQILYKMYVLSQEIPDLFYNCLSECQYLKNFILLLLKDDSNLQDTRLNHKTALIVINCVTQYGILDLFYLDGAINITKQLVHVTLFYRPSQKLCSLVLCNIIYKDKQMYLSKIFELLDYQQLLDSIQEGNRTQIYELFIYILENYHRAEIICKKIFIESNFVTNMKKIGEESLIARLAKVIHKKLDFSLEKYSKSVAQIYQIMKEHDFAERQEYLKEFEEHFHLACKQKEL